MSEESLNSNLISSFRSPYFQQYDSNQLRELCLIVDATKLFGQQLLFEEGQRGHAFYSILSGRVKVWVRGGKNRANAVSRRSSIDLDGDLGVMVTDLPQGITFGDQPNAIVRESSITTAEGLTQLLVIDKGEFETLLPLFESKQALDKVAILRYNSFSSLYSVISYRNLFCNAI